MASRSRDSLLGELAHAICEAQPFAAIRAAWCLICQGYHQELLRLLPILMLKEAALNVHVMARWLWWRLAIQCGWPMSEEHWQQMCWDVGFTADALASPLRDEYHGVASENDTYVSYEIHENLPADIQLGLFCLSIIAQRDRFLTHIVRTWRSRKEKEWEEACMDPAESCIMWIDFPKI